MSKVDSATLSLIYSTLAASASVPNQKGLSSSGASSSGNVGLEADFEEIKKLMPPVEPEEIQSLETVFANEIPCSFPSLGTIYSNLRGADEAAMNERVVDVRERIRKIRAMYDRELGTEQSLQSSIDRKLRERKLRQKESDLSKSEAFNMKEKLVGHREKFAEKQQQCRDLQAKCKEAQENKNKMLIFEKDKSNMLELEARESIDSVLQKIKEDQVELDKKELENEEMKLKLENFKKNLVLIRERAENEKKVADLTQKLKNAKKAQYEYNMEQQKLRENVVKASIRHQEEKIHQHKKQLKYFDTKFVGFESTITQSNSFLDQFEVKIGQLHSALQTLKDEKQNLVQQARQEDVRLISAMQQATALRGEVAAAKTQYEKTERKCRQLQEARKQHQASVIKANATILAPLPSPPLPPSTPSSTPSSTSSSTSALPPAPPTEVGVGSPVSSPSDPPSLRKSPPR